MLTIKQKLIVNNNNATLANMYGVLNKGDFMRLWKALLRIEGYQFKIAMSRGLYNSFDEFADYDSFDPNKYRDEKGDGIRES